MCVRSLGSWYAPIARPPQVGLNLAAPGRKARGIRRIQLGVNGAEFETQAQMRRLWQEALDPGTIQVAATARVTNDLRLIAGQRLRGVFAFQA